MQLVRQYPDSRFIGHAYISFADYYRDQGEFQNAVRLYDKVVTYSDSDVLSFGHYGAGVCRFNMNPADPMALEAFKKAIDSSKEGGAGPKAKARALRRDARTMAARSFAEVGKPSKAVAFFEKIGRGPDDEDMVDEMLEVVHGYYSKIRPDDAATLCTAMKKRDPKADC